jgi:hypothetical protein
VRGAQGDFRALEDELLCAMRDADLTTVDRLLNDSFVITTAGWLREPADKTTWVDALSVHALDAAELHDVTTRHYGDVVVAWVHSTQQGVFRGEPYTHQFRYTDVWVKTEAGWRLDVRHATLLPPRLPA